MKRLNRNMHGDDPAAWRLPDSRELAAQYLLLYEMSLPYGLDLNNQINVDKSGVKVVVAVRTLSSAQAIAFNARAEAWLREHASAVHAGYGTGTIMMFSHIGERNIRSMLAGTVVALVLISFMLLLMLRSVRLGFVSLLPNLLPAALGFGLWGIIDGEVGLSLSIVASMTLGIIVDDTVHFLVKYQRARNAPGASPEGALRHAFDQTGRAMVVTSLVLVAGFLVLSRSHFELNASMGLLTAIILVFAVLADLLLLGPLLLKLENDDHGQTSGHRPARPAGA
jgi:predicted RND superfamily exporter protein